MGLQLVRDCDNKILWWQQLQHVQLQHPLTAAAAGTTTTNCNYSHKCRDRHPSDWRPGLHGNDNDNHRIQHPLRRQLEDGSDCDGVCSR